MKDTDTAVAKKLFTDSSGTTEKDKNNIFKVEDFAFKIRKKTRISEEFSEETLKFNRYLSYVKHICDKHETQFISESGSSKILKDKTDKFIESTYKTVSKKLDIHFLNIWNIMHADTQFEETNITPAFSRYKAFYQKHIKHFFLNSFFIKQIHYKPQGYAGDFNILHTIYNEETPTEGVFNKLIEKYTVNITLGDSVRHRKNFIVKFFKETAQKKDNIHALSIASGSGEEFEPIMQAIGNNSLTINALDADLESLAFLRKRIKSFSSSKLKIQYYHNNIIDLLLQKIALPNNHDIIYSLGLFDYLNDKLFLKLVNKIYPLLSEDGTLVIGNVSEYDPARAYMALIGEWYLIHRSPESIKALLSKTLFKNISFEFDTTGSQAYAILKK